MNALFVAGLFCAIGAIALFVIGGLQAKELINIYFEFGGDASDIIKSKATLFIACSILCVIMSIFFFGGSSK